MHCDFLGCGNCLRRIGSTQYQVYPGLKQSRVGPGPIQGRTRASLFVLPPSIIRIKNSIYFRVLGRVLLLNNLSTSTRFTQRLLAIADSRSTTSAGEPIDATLSHPFVFCSGQFRTLYIHPIQTSNRTVPRQSSTLQLIASLRPSLKTVGQTAVAALRLASGGVTLRAPDGMVIDGAAINRPIDIPQTRAERIKADEGRSTTAGSAGAYLWPLRTWDGHGFFGTKPTRRIQPCLSQIRISGVRAVTTTMSLPLTSEC